MKWIDDPEISIPYFTFENLKKAGFPVNAFTTRLFRENGKDRSDLQVYGGGDSDPDEVEYLRDLLTRQFGAKRSGLMLSCQKHTANISVIAGEDQDHEAKKAWPDGYDGMVTDTSGVMLQTFGADCPSVFLADTEHRAIGLCHSGRKGTQYHISARMLDVMTREYGTRPEKTLAAVSPGICVSCYEVGEDTAADFIKDYLGQPGLSDSELLGSGLEKGVLRFIGGRYHIDLPRSISLSLMEAGVPAENIEQAGICTKCRSDIFYSFRAEGRIFSENSAVFMIRC